MSLKVHEKKTTYVFWHVCRKKYIENWEQTGKMEEKEEHRATKGTFNNNLNSWTNLEAMLLATTTSYEQHPTEKHGVS